MKAQLISKANAVLGFELQLNIVQVGPLSTILDQWDAGLIQTVEHLHQALRNLVIDSLATHPDVYDVMDNGNQIVVVTADDCGWDVYNALNRNPWFRATESGSFEYENEHGILTTLYANTYLLVEV